MAGFCASLTSGFISKMASVFAVSLSASAIILLLIYLFGEIFQNKKARVLFKEELMNIPFSVFLFVFVPLLVSLMCGMTIEDFSSLNPNFNGQPNLKILDSGEKFLKNLVSYEKDVFLVSRYYHMGLSMLSGRSLWLCGDTIIFLSPKCLFGSSSESFPSYGYPSYLLSSASILLNFSISSYLISIVHLLLFRLLGSGMFPLLVSLGLLFRSVPFLRKIGGSIMGIAFSFWVVYPFVLSLFYVAVPEFHHQSIDSYLDPSVLSAPANVGETDAIISSLTFIKSHADNDPYLNDYIFKIGEPKFSVLAKEVGKASFYSIFLMNLLMLATIAAAVHIGRTFGEEINLGRIVSVL